jgi:hypothetical protein
MKTTKLEIPCPACGSTSVFYSCTPSCCFNHVCEECTTTFQTGTTATGRIAEALSKPDPMPDGSEATAPCAKCQSIQVYQTDQGTLVCIDCRSVLRLELSDISVG